MNKHKVNYGLQSKIRSYVEYMWWSDTDSDEILNKDLISKLSSPLQNDLNEHVNSHIM